jgi:hypothetical protein
MKRSSIIIISFISLTIILGIWYVVLTKEYTKEAHNIDLYEGFVVREDMKTQETKVFFRTRPSGYTKLITTNCYSYFSDSATYDSYPFFNPGKKNSLPVKFKNLKFEIINGYKKGCFTDAPNYTIPIYMQKTFYFTPKAILIKSAITIKYENDTILIEKAPGRLQNSYTIMFEDMDFNLDAAFVNGKRTSSFLTDLHIRDIYASSGISNDMQSINKNIKTLSLLKPNGDTIESYHSITLKNYGNLTANWYVNRNNFKRLREYGIK